MFDSYMQDGFKSVCLKRLYLLSSSLYQDVTHGLDVFFSIIWWVFCLVLPRAGVTWVPSCTKPDSGITGIAVVFLISHDADSCSRMDHIGSECIEPFIVTVVLQGGLWTNHLLPRVTTQWGGAVLPVSDQWVQRVGLPLDDDEVGLFIDLHTKTDLSERCNPVGR